MQEFVTNEQETRSFRKSQATRVCFKESSNKGLLQRDIQQVFVKKNTSNKVLLERNKHQGFVTREQATWFCNKETSIKVLKQRDKQQGYVTKGQHSDRYRGHKPNVQH